MTREVLAWPFEMGRTVIDERFALMDIAGQGGMGLVYRVWDRDLERTCVLKMLAPKLHPIHLPQHDAPALLVREAKTLSQLAERSDSFVTVFHRGTAYVRYAMARHERNGRLESHVELDLPYYVMELLHGSNLETLIDSYRRNETFLPWSVVLKLSAQAARALCIAHEKDIVHRDIKPNNMFLHERVDRKPVVKYIDFGVSTKHGEPGVVGTGTKQYGSPELLAQSSVRPPENKQSDIYSLALVLYELAALHGPFEEHRSDYVYAHLNLVPPPLDRKRTNSPPLLVALLHAALSKKPEDRPTGVELATGLDAMRASLGADDDGADAQIAELLAGLRNRPRKQRPKRASVAAASSTSTAPRTAAPSGALAPQSDVWLQNAIPLAGERTEPWGHRPASLPARTEPLGAPWHARGAALGQESAPTQRHLVSDTDPDGGPLFSDPIPEPRAASAAVVPGEDDVPVLSSMARVFEGWEDDTQWRPSPFEEEEERRALPAQPRQSASPPRVAIANNASQSADGLVVAPTRKAHARRDDDSPKRRRALLRPLSGGVVAVAGFLVAAGVARQRALHDSPEPAAERTSPAFVAPPAPSYAQESATLSSYPQTPAASDAGQVAIARAPARPSTPSRKPTTASAAPPKKSLAERASLDDVASAVDSPGAFSTRDAGALDDLVTKISP